MKLFDLVIFVLSLFDLVRETVRHHVNRPQFLRAHLCSVQLAPDYDLLHHLVTVQRLKGHTCLKRV